ncbi:hypothetical protein ACF0H5_009511 [Mactra antiquata]
MEEITFVLIFVLQSLIVKSNAFLQYEVRVKENDEITLRCVEKRTGSRAIQWLKGSLILTTNNKVHKHNSHLLVDKPSPEEWNLLVSRITKSFTDVYTCRVKQGEILSNVTLIVETGPRIDVSVSTPEQTYFTEHSHAILKCKVSGEPPPKITWKRGTSETEIGITGESLRIPHIERYATDVYICYVNNTHGDVKRRMMVNVTFGPEVTVMNSTLHSSAGEEVFLVCRIQAYPLLDAYWTNNTNEIVKDSWKYTLHKEKEDNIPVTYLIMTIKPSISSINDTGIYTCFGVGENNLKNATVKLSIS